MFKTYCSFVSPFQYFWEQQIQWLEAHFLLKTCFEPKLDPTWILARITEGGWVLKNRFETKRAHIWRDLDLIKNTWNFEVIPSSIQNVIFQKPTHFFFGKKWIVPSVRLRRLKPRSANMRICSLTQTPVSRRMPFDKVHSVIINVHKRPENMFLRIFYHSTTYNTHQPL